MFLKQKKNLAELSSAYLENANFTKISTQYSISSH